MPDQARQHPGSVRRSVGLLVVLALAGLLFTTSIRQAQGESLRTDGVDNVALHDAEQARLERAAQRVADLTSGITGLTEEAAAGNSEVLDLRAEASRLAGPAGYLAVEGPTYVVSLDDAPSGVARDGLRPDELVVHQQDVQAVVNALWAGGAEAMTLMDQRVVSTTAVRCVGNTLLLHDRLYSPPYEIVALGDPDALQAALDRSPEVALYREYVSRVGLGWKAGVGGVRTLPAFTDTSRLRYATPE